MGDQGNVETISLKVSPRYALPALWYPVARPRARLLLMAALGVGARFYGVLARALADQGIEVLLLEQRGHGDSGLRASRRCNWGFAEALQEDIPAALDYLQQLHPAPVFCMGHSLGGHYSAMAAGLYPERVAGVIIAACGSPYFPAFDPPVRGQIRLLCHAIPWLTRICGFYPGEQLRFGGREATQLMRDWRHLALTNRYGGRGIDAGLDDAIARFTGPVLSIRMAEDAYAPARAMAAVTDKFQVSRVTQVVLDAQAIGDRADHFRWARRPQAVARAVSHWLQGQGY